MRFIFPILVTIEVILRTVPFLIYKRAISSDQVKRLSHTCLIIPCHKAELVISKTLESALQIFDANSIFVIDNGVQSTPRDKTPNICAEIGVNYQYVPLGNKTIAIYVGAMLAKDFEYVLQIDDDMLLDPKMSFPISEQTHCIAYTIGATCFDSQPKLIHRFQDLEYKMAGIMKGFESQISSATFAHGAISLWKRTTLLEVLETHPLYPLSDDWFMGCICNSLGYRIETCASLFTYTDVPSAYVLNRIGSRETGYGGVTLFTQRFRRWYRFTLVQIWYMILGIICSWKLPFTRALLLKIIWLIRICFTFLVMAKYVVLAISLRDDYIIALVSFSIAIASCQISTIVFVIKQLRPSERPSPLTLCLFPLYMLYDSSCFMISLYASIILMFPHILLRNKDKLTLSDKKIKVILNSRATQY
jgi:glycosyltransferase involved in cell wall biosynthesis